MPKYAWFGFDPKDTQDQYCIEYNNFADKSGDSFVLWFDSEDERNKQFFLDICKGIIFLKENENETE